MAVTPYIWFVWQTSEGRIFLMMCALIVLCIFLYCFICKYGWWCIPMALLLALGTYADYRQNKNNRIKEQERKKEESERFRRMLQNNINLK